LLAISPLRDQARFSGRGSVARSIYGRAASRRDARAAQPAPQVSRAARRWAAPPGGEPTGL